MQDHVQCVEVMDKLDQAKVFLLFNKLVLNVQDQGEEITNPCSSCNGQGKKQTSKRLSVTIPKGVDDGTRIRLAGKGEAGSRGAGNGDLIFIYKCLFT